MSGWNNQSRSSNFGSNQTNFGGASGSNFVPLDQNYGNGFQQGYYMDQVDNRNQPYQSDGTFYPNNQGFGRSGYTWYNPQFVPGFQPQEFVPSYVCQNSTYNESTSLNEEASSSNSLRQNEQRKPSSGTSSNKPENQSGRSHGKSNRRNNLPRVNDFHIETGEGASDQNGTDTTPRPTDRNNAQADRNDMSGSRSNPGGSNKRGANRLYRNPNVYYGTTQYPHRSNESQERGGQGPGGQGSGGTECSKTEDRRKLLAEVATLLNKDKKQVKAANTTKPDHEQYKDRSRGWAATPNQHPHQNKSSGKKEFRRSDNDYRRSNSKREPETQRERLVDQLTRGTLECLVCCERLRQSVPIWSCENCFHVLHLGCVSKWALTSTTKTEGIRVRQGTSWRCPACQFVYDAIPDKYTCFCTKLAAPKWLKGETPHCCGETCGKARRSCSHQCTLLCHPGPCPPCTATVQRECGCGRTRQSVKCSSTVSVECELLCAKMLTCGQHDCLDKCHQGPCKPCHITLNLACHCGREKKEVECGWSGELSCGEPCGKPLTCGEHSCASPCHPGACGPCPYDPLTKTTCHCGAKQIKRKSCTEPIESCGNKCSVKRAACTHDCTEICHPGNCPPCPVPVTSSCRCGLTASVQTTCYKLNTLGERPLCKKKCSKKRSCAKHKCNQECCNDSVHTCLLPCNRNLPCGQHRCELLCHRGNCPPCTRLGFDEMRCHCGFSVLYPPIECGTRPPECTQPCTREHDCTHAPTHTCHSLPECPPCTVLVSRTCYGGHETRKAVACYIAEYSCGLPCGKMLPCQHRCVERCHGGPCPSVCRQACTAPRDTCTHPCALPCHSGTPCSGQSPCSTPVEIMCQCSRRKQMTSCAEFRRTWTRHQAIAVATNKEQVLVDPANVNFKVMECDDDCKIYERNLRMAIGLQIANPDLSNKLKPSYSETMRQWAKRDPRFCDMVHSKLTQLVQLAKESKQKSRSYSFDVMSSTKRQFVHEYCKHFGCDSVAYDAEPKRNVVATAYRDRCWLPSYSLLEVIQRENGQRKVPLPSLNRKQVPSDRSSGVSVMREVRDSVLLPLGKAGPASGGTSSQSGQPSPRPPSPHIDYFDFTPTSS